MTEAFGPLPMEEVARRREAQGHHAGEILGVETRFLDFPDCAVEATPASAREVARVIAEVRPDAILTWGDAWGRGMRHPDHQACGRIFRDAITLARIAKQVAPLPPHRMPCPVFTYRGAHSALPTVAVDVEPWLEKINELAAFYRAGIGFGDREWMERRLRQNGAPYGLRYAEVFDAWETVPGVHPTLLPAEMAQDEPTHPDRAR
jgi:LmbE family N-acetylglucosaminyl deacetylase